MMDSAPQPEQPVLQHILQGGEHVAGAHADRSGHKFSRAVAALSLFAGGAIAGHTMGEHQSDMPETSQTQEHGSQISNRVELDLTVAAEVDTCATKVNANDAITIYQRLFSKEQPKTFKGVEHDTTTIIERVQDNVKKTPIASLTPEQKQFVENANTHRLAGTYRDYKKVLTEYLDQFNIQLIDTWARDTKIGHEMQKSGVNDTTRPLSPAERSNNDSAKVQMLNILQGMSVLPRSMIADSGVRKIFLGDSKDNSYDGIAYSDKGTLGFDIHKDAAFQFMNAYGIHNQDVAPHEFMHALDYALCNNFVGSYINDPGFESLNRAFKYGDDVRTQMEQGQIINSKYVTLENNTYFGTEAVVTRPYGATNANEDKATLFGENIMFSSRLGALFSDTKADPVVIQEKIAFLVARISAKDPGLGEYYLSLLEAGKIAQQVNGMAFPITEEMSNYVQRFSDDETHNFSKDPQYMALVKRTLPYTKLQSRLYSLISSGGLYSSAEEYSMK